jgi:hypothetical protein
MADKYAFGVDIAMLIISSLLVFSAASNEKIYDAGATFKRTDGKLRKSGEMLGMTAESVNKFNMLVSVLGSAAVGAYGLSIVYKKTSDVSKPKGPGIYTAVFGFAVSLGLILSGVISGGLHKEIATFKDEKKEKAAKKYKNLSYFMITSGSVALLLVIILVAKKKKVLGRIPAFAGGSNGVSTFFTYK